MICEPCRAAAEGRDRKIRSCSHCGREWVSVYSTVPPVERQSVVSHKYEKVTCPGSCRPPNILGGHDACNGCPCQHRPPGSWNHRE